MKKVDPDYFYKAIAESTSDYIFIVDPSLVIQYVNPYTANFLKFDREKMIGRNIKDIFVPQLLEIPLKNLDQVLKTKQTVSYENPFPSDGKEKWFHTVLTPLKDNNGNITTILGVARDITDRKQAEDKLKINEEYFHTLIENSTEVFTINDPQGKVTYISPAMTKVLGYSPEEIIGKVGFEYVHPDDQQKLMFLMTDLVSSPGKTISGEIKAKHKNGSYIWAYYTLTNLVQNPYIQGIVGNFHDITKEKEVDQAKTEFVSLASHQLRTPLSAIKWFIEMLLAGDAGELSERQRGFVFNVGQSGQRMIDLVNSLLDISHLETGKFVLEKEPTNLNKVVQKVVDDLKPKLIEKEQVVSVSLLPSLPTINTDPKHIANILSNLITNATKYSPNKTKINVSVSNKENQAVIEVSDNGYGIPKDEQSKVFEKFYRGSNIVKVSAEGTGLGLYIVKKIAEACGGKIWFASEEDKGTTFRFSLPLT